MSLILTDTGFLSMPLKSRGKVRDIYEAADQLLLIATDRVSAFDVVLPNGIAHKGQVLTQLSRFWFEKLAHIVPNHLITTEVAKLPVPACHFPKELNGRVMLVKKAEVIPVECVVRGYLSGSGWKEYRDHGTLGGMKLAQGYVESDCLPNPVFTPAAKNNVGHDENISFERMTELVGLRLATKLRSVSLALYQEAADYALQHGLILADTKFEFGIYHDEVILIDECCTPDSSRFWLAAEYVPGRSQQSLDKQFIRDWLETSGWNKEPPAPQLPDWVIKGTMERYLSAYQVLTGQNLLQYLGEDE
ncbi:MAG: phosphoribosylaminoimidazolesuccinocarboxamide synthase [Negativicutes bacterium]|nr:phosphoribosylaminoimidazolesuccinocarboxamide synthase [Negativicutes bacterium]